jgi:hypothetical protein
MRYLRFERWLNETLSVTGAITAVYFEEVRDTSVQMPLMPMVGFLGV